MWYVDPVYGVQPSDYAFRVGFEYQNDYGHFEQVIPNSKPCFIPRGRQMRPVGSNMTQIAGAADVTSAYTGHGVSYEEQLRRAMAASAAQAQGGYS